MGGGGEQDRAEEKNQGRAAKRTKRPDGIGKGAAPASELKRQFARTKGERRQRLISRSIPAVGSPGVASNISSTNGFNGQAARSKNTDLSLISSSAWLRPWRQPPVAFGLPLPCVPPHGVSASVPPSDQM